MMPIYSEILTGLIIISIILIGIGITIQHNIMAKSASIIFCTAIITLLLIHILIQSSEKKSSKEIEKSSFEKGYNKAMIDCKGDTINNQIIMPN